MNDADEGEAILKRACLKRACVLTLALIVMMPATAFSQTRRRTTTRRGGSRSATSAPAPDAVRAGAQRVAEQIKSLGQFLYLFGPIAKDLQGDDAAGRNDQLPPAASEMQQRNKAKLREAFRTYRQNMDNLEATFSGSSELRQYYTQLLGVAARAAAAEEQVAAGRYDQAGKSMLDVMNRLTDALLAMR